MAENFQTEIHKKDKGFHERCKQAEQTSVILFAHLYTNGELIQILPCLIWHVPPKKNKASHMEYYFGN